MAVTAIQFGSIGATYSEIFESAGRAVIRTFVEWSYTGNKPISLECVERDTNGTVIDINDTRVIQPNTKGSFDVRMRYMRVKSATSDFPTSGALTFSAMDNTSGIAGAGKVVGSASDTPYVSFSSLPAVANDGDRSTVKQLAGTGFFCSEYIQSLAKQTVCAGQSIVTQVDPLQASNAASTAAVDLPLCTFPAGIFTVGDIWELSASMDSSAGNTGSDTFSFLIGSGITIGPQSVAPNTSIPIIIRFAIMSPTVTRRVYASFGTAISTGVVSYSNDISLAQVFTSRITPLTIGNSSFIRNVSYRRIA